MPNINTPQVKEINAETGQEILREMNAKELAQLAADKETNASYEAAKAQQAADKAALLARLGLTEAELKTILG